MKESKIVIHLAKHLPTGAEVPVIVNKTDGNNTIVDYKEFTRNRKAFNLAMLQNRWDMCKQDVIELLLQYQVPAHVSYEHVKTLSEGSQPVDAALFFEEYIFGLEKKEKLKHNKLKSKKVSILQEH